MEQAVALCVVHMAVQGVVQEGLWRPQEEPDEVQLPVPQLGVVQLQQACLLPLLVVHAVGAVARAGPAAAIGAAHCLRMGAVEVAVAGAGAALAAGLVEAPPAPAQAAGLLHPRAPGPLLPRPVPILVLLHLLIPVLHPLFPIPYPLVHWPCSLAHQLHQRLGLLHWALSLSPPQALHLLPHRLLLLLDPALQVPLCLGPADHGLASLLPAALHHAQPLLELGLGPQASVKQAAAQVQLGSHHMRLPPFLPQHQRPLAQRQLPVALTKHHGSAQELCHPKVGTSAFGHPHLPLVRTTARADACHLLHPLQHPTLFGPADSGSPWH